MITLNVIGLVFVLLGSIALITANKKMFNMIKNNFKVVEKTLESLAFNHKDIVIFSGFDKHYDNIVKSSICRNIIGFSLILIGTVLQVIFLVV
jgi:uncharacterized membrane protein